MRVRTLQEYPVSLLDPLQKRENQEIYLVQSHGDPTASNSVELNGEALLIDWKQIAFRSALFDCFEFFFSRLRRHYDRNPGMPRELAKAINDVERRLLSSPGDNSWIGSVVSSADTYRLIYYVERLVKRRTQADKHIFAFDWSEKRVRDEA